MKKVLAVALAVLMLMMTAIPAFAAYSIDVIEEGDWLTVSLGADDWQYYSFIPETSGCYVIETFVREDCDYADPIIIVNLAENGDDIVSDDIYDLDAAVCFYANARCEYYIFLGDYNGNAVDYDVTINKYCADLDFDGYCDGCWDALCDCNCHEGGIIGFFWSIKNFFNMIFGLNEVCDCGAWHW